MTDEECVADVFGTIKKNSDICDELRQEFVESFKLTKNEIKCELMKEKGNKAFIQNDMKKAISCFNEAILLAPWDEGKFYLIIFHLQKRRKISIQAL